MKFELRLAAGSSRCQLVDSIVLADELGFFGAYGADETYHKDQWQIAAVAATHTKRIRLSPCVTHVILKEPTILAHSIATLDELSTAVPRRSSRSGTSPCSTSIASTGNPVALDASERRITSSDDARRGEDRLRGRVLPLHGPIDVGSARCRSRAAEDRRHARARVVPARRRDRRRHASGARILDRRRCSSRPITSCSVPSMRAVTPHSSISALGW